MVKDEEKGRKAGDRIVFRRTCSKNFGLKTPPRDAA